MTVLAVALALFLVAVIVVALVASHSRPPQPARRDAGGHVEVRRNG